MTDLACWRCGEGFVLRIHGGEHLLTEDELIDLLNHGHEVLGGAPESCSGDYIDLCTAAEARAKPIDLLSALGLAQRQPVRRRI